MEATVPLLQSVREINWKSLTDKKTFHSSPDEWEDQVMYFLLVDRFSDGNEKGVLDNAGEPSTSGKTPLFAEADENNAVNTPTKATKWRNAGNKWVGGNLKGLTAKLGYLQRLGVTAVWVSPVFKQAPWDKNSYHGYGIQNFLDIDPHFGTPDDLHDMVKTAHELGIYVVLDVIVNHAADVFAYAPDRYEARDQNGKKYYDVKWDNCPYDVKGFRDKRGKPTLPFGPLDTNPEADTWPDAGVWPRELQSPDAWTRKGEMRNWDALPEFEEGDFFAFKDVHLGDWENNQFVPSDALRAITDCYKYWIAFADLDGFRLDTVKHMGRGAVTFFAREIHEFAQSIGKTNFYLIGEIAGGRLSAWETLKETGLNAALALDELPTLFRDVVTGRASAGKLFDKFCSHFKKGQDDDPVWCGRSVVTFFDDHDQVGRAVKSRFAAEFGADRTRAERAVLAAVGLNLTVLGIPCLYYGTEQGFNGHAQGADGGDRYTREAMFGGEFGARGSRNRHFFDENHRLYQEIAALLRVRREHPALRRGHQYLRPLSHDGKRFADPTPPRPNEPYRGIVAWSRLLDGDDLVCVLNTDMDNAQTAWVTVDFERHAPGSHPLRCLYSCDAAQTGTETGLPEARNGSAVRVTVAPGGFAIWA